MLHQLKKTKTVLVLVDVIHIRNNKDDFCIFFVSICVYAYYNKPTHVVMGLIIVDLTIVSIFHLSSPQSTPSVNNKSTANTMRYLSYIFMLYMYSVTPAKITTRRSLKAIFDFWQVFLCV